MKIDKDKISELISAMPMVPIINLDPITFGLFINIFDHDRLRPIFAYLDYLNRRSQLDAAGQQKLTILIERIKTLYNNEIIQSNMIPNHFYYFPKN